MSEQTSDVAEFDNVPCPFCGLLCDDLRISAGAGRTAVVANGCMRSRELFSAAPEGIGSPLTDGRVATLEAAADRAAEILGAAAQTLCVSAGTDVAGMRALIELAERTRGIVDHMSSDAMFRNLSVLQDGGWISTTLTEVRNRADLLIVAGTDVTSRLPRFFERCFSDTETMFATGAREIWFLGALPEDLPAALKQRANSLGVEPRWLAEVFAALRSLLLGRNLQAETIAGLRREQLSALLSRMQRAQYGVLAWAAGDLVFPHAELAVQSMCELVQALNVANRFAVLPLAGNDADVTAMQVTTWQTGFPLRVSFADGAPRYDPWQYSASRRIERREADALVYVSALDAKRVPPSGIPAIFLGRPGAHAVNCDVFIPVATPGIHHAGHLYRTDNVVAMRMRKLVPSSLPSAADALRSILLAMRNRP